MHRLNFAKTKGLKKSVLKKLQKLEQFRIPSHHILNVEFAETIAELSHESGHPISAILDRKGQVVNLYIGLPSEISTPELRQTRTGPGRLCGYHIIYTHLASRANQKSNSTNTYLPSKDDLQALAKNRFDLMTRIEVAPEGTFSRSQGEQIRFADAVTLAHLLPQRNSKGELWKISKTYTVRQVQEERLTELIASLEEEFKKITPKLQVNSSEEKAILVGLITEGTDPFQVEDDLDELSQLARTAGATICGRLTQARLQPDPKFFLGSGKVQELALLVQEFGANLVIVDQELSANQQRNLEEVVAVKVIDRTELILDIFAQRAQTKEGKLQVELAQMKYLYPRLAGKGLSLSRLGAGIATRGPGETKLEIDRRHIRNKITHLEQNTIRIRNYRDTQRRQRFTENLPVVALTGYTNSGKSTLLNSLTNSDTLIEDKLFATLDPATRRTTLPDLSPCLFTDTVGFIKKLPTTLISAFRGTLEEVAVADLVIHVVDASHPNVLVQINSVYEVLSELGCLEKPMLTVLNKIDRVRAEDLQWIAAQVPNPIFVSAIKRQGLTSLLTAVQNLLQEVCPHRQRYSA